MRVGQWGPSEACLYAESSEWQVERSRWVQERDFIYIDPLWPGRMSREKAFSNIVA